MKEPKSREGAQRQYDVLIKINLLPRVVYAGDWHDAPAKWEVLGPNSERQIFARKKDAELYRRIRRRSATFNEAQLAYVLA